MTNLLDENADKNNMAVEERVCNQDNIVLPLPPTADESKKFEMEIYARFMRHLRHVPNSRPAIKVLSSIQFTADMLDTSDALVSKILVDLGLRAPRKAFPMTFLDFADKSMQRAAWEPGCTPESVVALNEHWNHIGEERFRSLINRDYAVQNETVFI